MSKTFRSACRNKHSEDFDGFYRTNDVIIKRKYGVSYDKFVLLKAWYELTIDMLKEDNDFYDDDGVFVPSESLDEFITRNKNLSCNKIQAIVYSY